MISIIPAPVECHVGTEAPFVVTASTQIRHDSSSTEVAHWLSNWLGFEYSTLEKNGQIVLSVDPTLMTRLGKEGYTLTSRADGIIIRGATPAGVFYGVQSLRQLLPADAERLGRRAAKGQLLVPNVEIEDRPRFSWRGAHLDVSRYFASVAEVKQFLDLMTLHKLNVFHWHLTDDQGWRLEIKSFPKLTEIGAWRNKTIILGTKSEYDDQPHGGYYTQEEVHELVAYAAARFIRVMPEIEVPGHSSAALASYPEFGNRDLPVYAPQVQERWAIFPYIYAPKAETLDFLDRVFTEVLTLFPEQFIHVGGDEAKKEQWENSPAAKDFMKMNGFATPHEIQSYFIGHLDRFLAARGRRLVGWDEIQEGGLAPGATVMIRRGAKGAAEVARSGHDVVMTTGPATYFDYGQDPSVPDGSMFPGRVITLAQAYAFEPVPAELEPEYRAHILGAQGQLWREAMPGWPRVQYQAFPRLSALSEVLWTPSEKKNYKDFRSRLISLLARFDRMGINYRRPTSSD